MISFEKREIIIKIVEFKMQFYGTNQWKVALFAEYSQVILIIAVRKYKKLVKKVIVFCNSFHIFFLHIKERDFMNVQKK